MVRLNARVKNADAFAAEVGLPWMTIAKAHGTTCAFHKAS